MEVLLFFCVFIGYLCISIHEMSVQIFFSIFMLHYFSLVLIGSSSSCVLNTCICITYTYIPNMMSIHTYIQVSTNLLLHVYRSDYIPRGSDSKESAAMKETRVWSLGWEDPLEKEMATHSSILAWRIQWAEEPGRLQSPWGRKDLDTTERPTLSLSGQIKLHIMFVRHMYIYV